MTERRHPIRWSRGARAGLVAALAALATGFGPAAGRGTDGTREDGAEVRLLVEAPRTDGRAPAAADLEIRYDGRSLAPASVGPWDPRRDPIRVLVYVDVPLVAPEALERALGALARQASVLARLGQVELVVADPDPVSYLEPGRDADALRAALAEARRHALPGELRWLRERFRAALALGPPDAAAARRALQEELHLIARQRSALRRWIGQTCGAGGGLLLLVSDGFDPDPRGFYLPATGEVVASLPDERTEARRLARDLAADGWTVAALAMGRRDGERAAFSEPLEDLATQSGGALVGRPKSLTGLLAGLEDRFLVTLRLPAAAEATPRPLEVRLLPAGKRLSAGRWAAPSRPRSLVPTSEAGAAAGSLHAPPAAGSAQPVIRLLPPIDSSPGERVLLRAVVARTPLRRVAFFVQGREVASLDEPPWQVEVEAGEPGRPRRVRAVAYSRRNRPLGSDSVVLDRGSAAPGVEITELEGDPTTGRLRVTARITAPGDGSLERVDFYWRDRLAASLSQAPYEAEITHPDPGLDDFVRVVARLRSGEQAEDARPLAAGSAPDRLEVNLVGVYAVVSRSGGGRLPRLERSDFLLFAGAEERPIERFLESDALPLLLGLAIDTSDSMADLLPEAKRAARRFLEGALEPDDRVFLVDFSERPRLLGGPTGAAGRMTAPLAALRPGGDTALYDSVAFALLQLEGHAGRKAVVVVTDGRDRGSRLGPEDCLRLSRRLGAPIFGISPGAPPDPRREPQRTRFAELVRRSGGSAHYVAGPQGLEESYRAVRLQLKNQYYLAFASDRELAAEELAAVRVELPGRPFRVRTVPAGPR